mmetsp:Transcript_8225/g.24379  ORF Transcript_8225/g.24379 Transcript_8225/m.24379 type:complete len:216 (-) Transcript_8225:796-1443(-)
MRMKTLMSTLSWTMRGTLHWIQYSCYSSKRRLPGSATCWTKRPNYGGKPRLRPLPTATTRSRGRSSTPRRAYRLRRRWVPGCHSPTNWQGVRLARTQIDLSSTDSRPRRLRWRPHWRPSEPSLSRNRKTSDESGNGSKWTPSKRPPPKPPRSLQRRRWSSECLARRPEFKQNCRQSESGLSPSRSACRSRPRHSKPKSWTGQNVSGCSRPSTRPS